MCECSHVEMREHNKLSPPKIGLCDLGLSLALPGLFPLCTNGSLSLPLSLEKQQTQPFSSDPASLAGEFQEATKYKQSLLLEEKAGELLSPANPAYFG